MTYHIIISILILTIAYLGIRLQKIDVRGGIIGIVLAYVIWFGSGEITLLALFIFFVIGSAASSWKKKEKSLLKLAQENEGKRGIRNVLGNGGVAGLLSFIAFLVPEHHTTFFVMTISSLASACSDTLSSELGNIYGRKYFNITHRETGIRGQDGVVSLEGFLFGLIGSASIAILPGFFHFDWKVFIIITVAGFLGNIIDSILGATLQRDHFLSNHSVNFWSTLGSAIISFLMLTIFC